MSIPKKPLAVSRAKKKLPVELDWGPGVLKDRLAYINAEEKALIQRFRKTKAAREYAGVPAFASDSASSKGVERGADGPSGVGRGPSGGGSSTSSSSSGSKSTSSSSSTSGGGNKSASGGSPSTSGTSTSWGGPSKSASSASTRASSPSASPSSGNKSTSGTSTAWGGPATNAAATSSVSRSASSTSKAPNAAASYASSKLNATANALKSAQQPQSIQGMINSGISDPVSYSGQFDNGYYHSFSKGPLPGQANPNQFDRTIGRTNMVNANHIPMDQFSNGYDPNKLTDGAQKIHQAIVDNAFRTGTPVDFFSGARAFNPKSPTVNHPSRQAIDVRLKDPITGAYVGADQIGSRASNPIGSVNTKVGRGVNEALANQAALEGPYRSFATGVINSFMDNPGVYGDFNNQRWGGAFGPNSWKTDKSAKDYMHFDEGKVMAGVSSDQNALRKEAMNYNGPTTGTQIAGNTPASISSALAAASPPRQAPEASAPTPQSIPSPISQGMLNTRMAQSQVVTDPRVSRPPGSLAPSQAPVQQAVAAPPQPSYAQSLPGRIPGYTPVDPARTKVAAAAPSPSPVYSDNPIQGPSNPMQEGVQTEDPGVTKQRQNKYASTGATIGSVIAGPLGAVVGGTLGWQMGKTPPQQRQAIASNPKAVQANVQSINQMVEERGGKGNPQMRVTESGFRDVLTNPQKVTQNPEQYTTLEQMLAALAQGIDPETGKPIA